MELKERQPKKKVKVTIGKEKSSLLL